MSMSTLCTCTSGSFTSTPRVYMQGAGLLEITSTGNKVPTLSSNALCSALEVHVCGKMHIFADMNSERTSICRRVRGPDTLLIQM